MLPARRPLTRTSGATSGCFGPLPEVLPRRCRGDRSRFPARPRFRPVLSPPVAMEAAGAPEGGRDSAAGRPARYSPGTRELLRAIHPESPVSDLLVFFIHSPGGDALPLQRFPPSSKQPAPASYLPACQPRKLPARPLLRPAKVCQAGDAYTREKFKPQPMRDLEKEKRRLQNILATGKDEVEDKMEQVFVQKKEDETAEHDRFEELMNEIQERREFLAEMEALGQGKEYDGIILTEISQKMHEMEIIDKKRSEEMRKIMTKDFPGGNKSNLHD
uniref:Chromosome 22 open reading frame 23 n=1 Tax=Malurus cyaneus samueli TaxID=2593467 RepID=A0A8C5X1V1_9PASS